MSTFFQKRRQNQELAEEERLAKERILTGKNGLKIVKKKRPKYFKISSDDKHGTDLKWTQDRIGKIKKTGSNFINIIHSFNKSNKQNADYWVAEEIKKLFREKEYNLNLHGKKFITLFLWGASFLKSEVNRNEILEQNSYKICWIYSHPTAFKASEAKYYDKIFFASEASAEFFSGILQQPNISKVPIHSFSSFEEPKQKNKELEHNIVFVANARGYKKQFGRDIIGDLDPSLDVSLWGRTWPKKRKVNPKWIKGLSFPFWSLPDLYKSSKICLNDHHVEHNNWDYVSFRIFDIVKSGGFCISDYNPGIEKIFGDTVVTYKTKKELNNKIKYFLAHPKERESHIIKAQEKIKDFTAKKIIKGLLRESDVLK